MKLKASSHIDIDVAIEIINGMIADAYVYINEIDHKLYNLGLSYDNLTGAENRDLQYEEKFRKVAQYRNEISQIYDSKNVHSLLHKVETEYAPFLKQERGKRVKVTF